MRKYFLLLPILLFSIFWGLLLTKTGTINSGIHFQDDHEIISIHSELKEKNYNVFSVFSSRMSKEINEIHRFRPLYYLHRIIEVAVFKNNFLTLSIYNLTLIILTSSILFFFGLGIGFSYIESLLFPVIVLLGGQSEISWMLGPAETIAIFTYSLSLLCLIGMISRQGSIIFYTIGYHVFLVLSALSKESFILIIPATTLLQVWLYHQKLNLSWGKALKKNLISISFLALFTLVILIYIKKYIGTTGIGYAGVDQSVSFLKYYSTFETFFTSNNLSFSILTSQMISIGAIVIYSCINKKDNLNKIEGFLDLYLFLIILVLLISIPQFILYTKSGLLVRYLLPVSFSVAYMLLLPLNYISKLFPSKINYVSTITLSCITIGINIYPNFVSANNSAINYTQSGRQSNGIISSINVNVPSNKNKYILIVIDPTLIPSSETQVSLKVFIRDYINKQNPVYFQFIPADNSIAKELTDLQKDLFNNLNSLDKGNTIKDIGNKSVISSVIIFPGLEEYFLISSKDWFVAQKYKRSEGQNFIHYYE